MKHKRKFLQSMIVLVIIFSTVITFAACDKGNSVGEIYSLSEAYEAGLLTQEELQSIAAYHNNGENLVERLDQKTEEYIRQTAAYKENQSCLDAGYPAQYTAENFTVLDFYGSYNGCVVVNLDSDRWIYTTGEGPFTVDPITGELVKVDLWTEVGGVRFHLKNRGNIVIWKEI